jgi:hypothetical protein
MKGKQFIWILGLLVLCAMFSPMSLYRLFHPPSEQDVIKKVFQNREIFDAIVSSQQVTAQLLQGKDENDPTTLIGYTKNAPVPLSPDESQKIKTLLQKPSSYLWNIGNTCLPKYGVLFNFHSGGRTVRIAFCFRCNMIGVFNGEDDNARPVNAEYIFEPMRGQLVTLCKTIFPNDKEIQALPVKAE